MNSLSSAAFSRLCLFYKGMICVNRLTIRNSDGSVSQPTHTTFEAVFNRLAEYEDTELTPQEIEKLKTHSSRELVYVIILDWMLDGNKDSEITVFRNRDDAERTMKRMIQWEKKHSWVADWIDDPHLVMFNSCNDSYWTAYVDGEYDNYNTTIRLQAVRCR